VRTRSPTPGTAYPVIWDARSPPRDAVPKQVGPEPPPQQFGPYVPDIPIGRLPGRSDSLDVSQRDRPVLAVDVADRLQAILKYRIR
jgi:hypothetical protein